MLTKFHHRDRTNKELNATSLTLILKIPILAELKDLDLLAWWVVPITLLPKILANRLNKVLPHIICPFQGTSVLDRWIHNGVLIANNLSIQESGPIKMVSF